MGATGISGSFSSSNWKVTIDKLKKEATRYYRLPDGTYEEDEDCYYDGTIYSIDHWSMREMHGKSQREIEQYLNNAFNYMDKGEGIVIEGSQVGYDIYRPTFENVNQSIPGYTRYFDGRLVGCVLLEKQHIRGGLFTGYRSRDTIEVIKRGTLEECKEEASNKLYFNTDKVYIICTSSGKAIKCYNSVRRVKETKQRSQYGKLKIEPVYNYYWAGWAAE